MTTQQVHTCGHAAPIEIPDTTLRVGAPSVALVLDPGDHYGATIVSLLVELPPPIGSVCVRLDGGQYANLRASMNALTGLTVEQIRALDIQLHSSLPGTETRNRRSPAAMPKHNHNHEWKGEIT